MINTQRVTSNDKVDKKRKLSRWFMSPDQQPSSYHEGYFTCQVHLLANLLGPDSTNLVSAATGRQWGAALEVSAATGRQWGAALIMPTTTRWHWISALEVAAATGRHRSAALA